MFKVLEEKFQIKLEDIYQEVLLMILLVFNLFPHIH
jgi:hypothetical protein